MPAKPPGNTAPSSRCDRLGDKTQAESRSNIHARNHRRTTITNNIRNIYKTIQIPLCSQTHTQKWPAPVATGQKTGVKKSISMTENAYWQRRESPPHSWKPWEQSGVRLSAACEYWLPWYRVDKIQGFEPDLSACWAPMANVPRGWPGSKKPGCCPNTKAGPGGPSDLIAAERPKRRALGHDSQGWHGWRQ